MNTVTLGNFTGELIPCESRQSFVQIKLCPKVLVVVAKTNKFKWPKANDAILPFIAYIGFESQEEAKAVLKKMRFEEANFREAERLADEGWNFELKIKGISANWINQFALDNAENVPF